MKIKWLRSARGSQRAHAFIDDRPQCWRAREIQHRLVACESIATAARPLGGQVCATCETAVARLLDRTREVAAAINADPTNGLTAHVGGAAQARRST